MSNTTALALPDQWKRDVQEYESKQFNVLAPRELGPIPPYHTPRLSVVEINPDPKGGDCYPLPAGRLGLSKIALDRISQAAGITWLPELCGRVDDGRDPNIIRYKAVGRIKDLNGQWRTIIGEKEIDLLAIEDELRESVPKREWISKIGEPAKKQKAIEEAVRSDLIQFRKHKLARAQSGAMNRAIRSALALRSQYTPNEIAKPFVIPKVIFTPDYSDPEVKKFMLAEATGHLSELYGAPAISATLPPALPPAPEEDSEDPITSPATSAPTNGDGPKSEPPSPPDPNLADEAAFKEAYNGEEEARESVTKAECIQKQQDILRRLMPRKGYDEKKLKAPLATFDRKQRLQFFQHLFELKDIEQASLPW